MKLNNIQNQTFFKRNMLAKCSLKSKKIDERQNATLYSLDPKNMEDIVYLSNNTLTGKIYENFRADKGLNLNKYYILENDTTNETIAVAQTSRRIKPVQDDFMHISVIDDMVNNSDYINSSEPMLAIIAKEAQKRGDENVVTYNRDISYSCPPNIYLYADDRTCGYINQKQYNSLISKAQSRSQIDYFI